jgi:FkbH-like protein
MITLSGKENVAAYLSLYRKVESAIHDPAFSSLKRVRIALLTSFTTRGLREILGVKCAALNVLADIYVGQYNQYQQELLDEKSQLYQFKPDILFLFIDLQSLLGDAFFFPYQWNATQRHEWVNEHLKKLLSLIEIFKSRSSAMLIVHNFEVPTYSPLGILENRQPYGYIESVEDLNRQLRESVKQDARTFLLDYEAFCSKLGKDRLIDPKMYYLADLKLDLQHFPLLCDRYLAYIKPILHWGRKCLVVDLDDTLWGGVVGEEGLEGIRLGPDAEGRPYWEFQKLILALSQRGVILAINSKNNREEALEVIHTHPYMVLREEQFASIQINWADKVANMRAIAEDLNIGLDSLVFVDNDPLNRQQIRQALPEVFVLELPDDPSGYLPALENLNEFNTLQLTEEDLYRNRSYAVRREMKQAASAATDIAAYLKELSIEVIFQKANEFSLPRLAQLTQKTNQFNMTTRRYTLEQIARLAADSQHRVISVSVQDKFGDHGIVGLLILDLTSSQCRIDTFLMSCRIIGREIEKAMLAIVIDEARKGGASEVIGEFMKTEKNTPATGFYQSQGFKQIEKSNHLDRWTMSTTASYRAPEYLRITIS